MTFFTGGGAGDGELKLITSFGVMERQRKSFLRIPYGPKYGLEVAEEKEVAK